MPWHVEAARAEIERLGVRVGQAVAGGDRIGFDIGEDQYTATPEMLETEEGALDWALIVAVLVRGVEA